MLNRLDDAKTKRSADCLPVARRRVNHLSEKWFAAACAWAERLLAQHTPEDAESWRVRDRLPEIEVEVCARIRPDRIDETPLAAVGAEDPPGIEPDAAANRFAPQSVERRVPCRREEQKTVARAFQDRMP